MIEDKSFRDIPIEELREFYSDLAERTSLTVVALTAGIGRTTLHKFVSGGSLPRPRVRRQLALAYLRATRNGPEDLRPVEQALGVLLARVPRERMTDSIGEVIGALERAHRTAGLEPPEWIGAIRAGGLLARMGAPE